jgi:hypothetical protein
MGQLSGLAAAEVRPPQLAASFSHSSAPCSVFKSINRIDLTTENKKTAGSRPAVLSFGVDALDFALSLLTLPLWGLSLLGAGRCENLIAQTRFQI